ncbi:MAG: site-specific DNA-methyltransferase, partial [Peptostreptococcaceae bacterium]|nr:site-specific DNA-methyltransferase [Peptostreptococcaceae bacterium]
MYKLYKGDCLEVMKEIPTGSVDMILCDLPYGTTECKWDSIIPLDRLWTEYERIIKEDGAIVLTAAQPFTTQLIESNRKRFRYCWYWIKNTPTGFCFVKYQPMRKVEDV